MTRGRRQRPGTTAGRATSAAPSAISPRHLVPSFRHHPATEFTRGPGKGSESESAIAGPARSSPACPAIWLPAAFEQDQVGVDRGPFMAEVANRQAPRFHGSVGAQTPALFSMTAFRIARSP